MVAGIYLSMDQTEWYRNDFSDTDLLTGTIYTDINRTSAKNLTGFTVTIRMNWPNRLGDRFGKEATIVSAANGTWSYAVADGDMPQRGVYYIAAEISDATNKQTTLNRVEFQVLGGASG